jgi:hypothetical protein
VVLNTLAVLFLGLFTYRKTGNLPLSLALQLTPFLFMEVFSLSSVVMLEPLLLCTEMFLLALIADYTFGFAKNIHGKSLASIALLMALGIATKIVFIPVVFLPFFAIEGIRKKLVYILITLISLAIMLIPIYPTFSSFLAWNTSLFTHTGSYGSGNYDLFDLQAYTKNLNSILHSNIRFTVVLFLITATTLFSFIPSIGKFIDPKKRKILLGLTLVFVVNIIMVAKHYSFHYLFISYNLVIFGLILWLSVFPFYKFTKHPVLNHVLFKISVVYFISGVLLFSLIRDLQFSPSFSTPRLKGLEYVKSAVGNTQRIIVLESSGPFIETALLFGFAYSNGMKPEYAGILKQHYPASYFYDSAHDYIYDWIHEHNLTELLSRSQKTYLYYHSDKDTMPAGLQVKLNGLKQKGYVTSIKTAFRDPESHDYIYVIESDTQKIAGNTIRHETVLCSFDSLAADSGYFSTSDTAYSISKADMRTTEMAFSGKYSVKLNKDVPYGPGVKIISKKGYYEINVRRFSADNTGFIVATDSTGTRLYKANGIADDVKPDWQSLTLHLNIPDAVIGEEISIFLWYPGRGTCYFDDLGITYFEVP